MRQGQDKLNNEKKYGKETIVGKNNLCKDPVFLSMFLLTNRKYYSCTDAFLLNIIINLLTLQQHILLAHIRVAKYGDVQSQKKGPTNKLQTVNPSSLMREFGGN